MLRSIFSNSKDILIVDDMNQLCERTAASSDDTKKSVIWMQRRVNWSFIVHFSASSTSEILQKVSPKENKMLGTKLFYVHL